jgi:dinuclear metal center YbgI/SA1388 family protein
LAHRDEIIRHANELLEVERFPEYGRPGLQVLGADEVTKIACGVSSSRELFERAAASGAQLVLVHHGMFWRNEPVWIDRRQRGRLEALFAANLSLAAYHLALDAHPELGNNALLAGALGVTDDRCAFGEVGVGGCLHEPWDVEALVSRVREVAGGREPLVYPHGPEQIQRVAICSGGASGELIRAAHEGYDLYLTGEPGEPSLQTARELGIHFVAAGHDATERLGVQALARNLAERFDLDWEFIPLENPV